MKVTAVGLRKSYRRTVWIDISDLRYRPRAPNAAQQLAFPLPSQALAQRHLEHFSGWCSGARLCGNGAPPRSSRAKLATVLHIIARNALARYQKFDLPLNFSNRDGSKVGVTQSLIELRKSCLLESGPLCDACLYLLA